MSAGFGDDFKEQVRAATSIVDIVSETVALIPNGRDYKALCPFHDDRNPSLNVYPDRQSYRCWVCEAGGDAFTWVMETEKVPFPEALERLAERARIEPPRRTNSDSYKQNKDRKTNQYEIAEWASTLMQQVLLASPEDSAIRRYVEQRNLSADTVRSFRLGYHPEDWSWFLDKAKGKFTEQQLLSVGIVGERDNGRGFYDNLVGRLVFPILDEQSRPVSFGGRVLPEGNIQSNAKYWNGPESSIFRKRRTLYAFDRARETIRRSKTAIVVEGYMDCIACHQAGVTNVVATLGTAMSVDNVKFLKRFAEQVVLLYDGDNAGQQAAEKSITHFLAEDLDLRILTLDDGQDPADYLAEHTKEDFLSLIQASPEAWAYKLQTVQRRFGTDSVSGRQQIANSMVEFLAEAPGLVGTMREDLIVKNVCQRIQVDERTFRQQVSDTRRKKLSTRKFIRRDEPDTPEPLPKKMKAADLAERELLEIILSTPETIDDIRHQIGPDDFHNEQPRRLLELCFDLFAEEGILPEPRNVIAACESDPELLNLVNALLDSAQEKGISKLMQESILEHEETGEAIASPHLERVMRPLRLRRDTNQKMLSKQKLAQAQQVPASELLSDNDAMAALRKIELLRKREMGNPSSLR